MPRADLVLQDPAEVGVDPAALERLYAEVEKLVAPHPGCAAQVAVARGGRVAGFRAFGEAPFSGEIRPVSTDTLFCSFSVTKAFVSSAVWMLLEEGKLRLEDRVADLVPAFGRNGKEGVTVEQLLTHTAGFPSAEMAPELWLSEERRLERFGDWVLEWEPGSRFVYHGGSTMWVLAQLITQLTGTDYRDFVRTRVFEPAGATDLYIGLPEAEHARLADVVVVGEPMTSDEKAVSPVDAPVLTDESVQWVNRSEQRSIGNPGGGGIGTAADVALFYQAVIGDRADTGPGLWHQDTVAAACMPRNVELIDAMTGQPALRGLGVVLSGEEGRIWRGFAPNNGPFAFGHMGAGGQCSWGDPDSGISFAFLTNGAQRNAAEQGTNAMRLSRIAAGARL